MNIYVVVEGRTEHKVYRKWIPYLNPKIVYVGTAVSDITTDSFAIITGGGLPYYFQVIKNAIEDVNDANHVDRLVVVVDSENMTREEKHAELLDFINRGCQPCIAPVFIVVQHFCLETWALGNRCVGPRDPQGDALREYKERFCVYENDPELLPAHPPKYPTRAQFASVYLKTMLKDRDAHLSYSKPVFDTIM